MNSLYILIPITVVLLLIAVAAWLWSVRNGQYDDLENEASRILFDESERGEVRQSTASRLQSRR